MGRVDRKIEVNMGAAMPAQLIPWLQHIAEHHGELPALVAGSGSNSLWNQFSFAELHQRSAALARGLYRLGLRRGDALAIWLPNRPEWMLLHFAAARLGLLSIPINTWCRESEVAHFLAISGCKAIALAPGFKGIDFASILSAALRSTKAKGIDNLRWMIDGGGSENANIAGVECVPLAELLDESADNVDAAENTSVITYSTSGTTAAPKLAVHGEHSLVSHAVAVARESCMTGSDVVLGALPPCGAYGYGIIMAGLSAGARVVLCEEFNLDDVMKLIAAERVTVLALTEPLLRRMLDHPDASRSTFQTLRIAFSAGGTLQPVVTQAASEFGFRISNVYGSSEVLALASFWPLDADIEQRSLGGGYLASSGMRVRAVDSAGNVLPKTVKGELQFSGPTLSVRYLNNEAATHSAFSEDGWFRSKDLGYVLDEEGRQFVYISRMDDAIRIAGFLVSPSEIEDMLQSHPEVLSAQVVGIPDGKGEELAAAFVITQVGAQLQAAALREYCKQRMASYKVPTIVHEVSEYPVTKSANGDKVMKNRLREMAKGIQSA